MGTGLKGIRLADVEVCNDRNGRPGVVLHGTASMVFEAGGGGRIHLSLSHERGMACGGCDK